MQLDSHGDCYMSDHVEASEGEFDGQIVFGHSYCYALKKFVIDKSSSVVVLELDVSKMTEPEPEGRSLITMWRSGDMYMYFKWILVQKLDKHEVDFP